MKYLVIAAFLAIVASLGAALFFMTRGSRNEADPAAKSRHMARALAFRVGFSVLLFICMLVAWKLGWVNPTGIPVGK